VKPCSPLVSELRNSRKVEEIERSGKMTLAYQFAAENQYVRLVGRAIVNDDFEVKNAIWKPASLRWHPGGPNDSNVVLIDFVADRIELWSSKDGVVPAPLKGLWAAALTRKPTGWRHHGTSRQTHRGRVLLRSFQIPRGLPIH
jgi:hypothetical protein